MSTKTKNLTIFIGRIVGDPAPLPHDRDQLVVLVDTAKPRLNDSSETNIQRCIVAGRQAQYLLEKQIGSGSTVYVEARSRSRVASGAREDDPMAPREVTFTVGDIIVHDARPSSRKGGLPK